ncbi:zinc finger domain containing protein [Nitzschia inconspicua]|uniref:Zinc finger domain containing protein n=1 Tax=Nitzschia inconspicua TaxID=303405 RepID=A0A9K3LHA8_9STRA|nr:zinc finger domain containing protein [Nitzschia inconspicua]
MSSYYRNVAMFVPAPPLYQSEDTAAENVLVSTTNTTNIPTVVQSPSSSLLQRDRPPTMSSIQRAAIQLENDKKDSHNSNGNHKPSTFRDFSPFSTLTCKVSTLDPTSPSYANSTPPTSPHQWKRIWPRTPSSTTTAATAVMTPTSTTSLSSSYHSTPALSSSSTKSMPYAVAVCMGINHRQTNDSASPSMPCCISDYQSPLVSFKDDVISLSLTTSSLPPFNSPKKKAKNVSPSKRSSNKKMSYHINSTGSLQPDDANGRKQRIKTELCMHYVRNKSCPFGNNCTYAHGEDELQTKTLGDLQQNGLLDDVQNYRTKPCFTFVAMGSCPFGRRCNAIHDPRVAGDLSSWLPLTETQGNNIATDINVEGLHQKRHYSIIAGNPFGEKFSIDLDGWNDLYKLVTNTTAAQKRRKNTISEVHKLSIAIQMRGTHEWMYKYRPQHIIFQDTCMVLRCTAFRLDNETGNAIPISKKYYKSEHPNQVMVHELAFGPDSDPSVRGVALWFNIPEKDITEVAPQQAKRFRWKKPSKFDDSKVGRPSVFDTRECFDMLRPTDQDAFELATKILQHRFETVKAERLSSMEERFESLKILRTQKLVLEDLFHRQKRSWISWTYPINNGRQRNDADTPIPPVDDEYHPIVDEAGSNTYNTMSGVCGSAVEGIWRSFVTFMAQAPHSNLEAEHDRTAGPKEVQGRFQSRLPTFVQLSRGEPISPHRALPHITRSNEIIQRHTKHPKLTQYAIQSERCWKSLLLTQEDPLNETSEWNIVMDHFQNFSRSKKVLSILQQ